MAILQVVAVKDRALEEFMQPFFVPALGLALRSFADAINDPQHELHKHPDDYDLWHLGVFDAHTGSFSTNTQDQPFPRQLAIGKNFIRP